MAATKTEQTPQPRAWGRMTVYQDWVKAQELPIHRGYYIEDIRTVELGWWVDRITTVARELSR